MLTDIFAHRYSSVVLFPAFGENDRRLIVQAFRILDRDLMPYYDGKGAIRDDAVRHWQSVHDKLCRELGFKELSPRAYAYTTTFAGKPTQQFGTHPWVTVCETYVLAAFDPNWDSDTFIKNRLSFIEIALRDCEQRIVDQVDKLKRDIAQAALPRPSPAPGGGVRIPGSSTGYLETFKRTLETSLRDAIAEFNERLRRAGYPLHYHNGLIQISKDVLVQQQVEQPFWALVADPKWKNVDHDMKEAIDLRDSGGRDPAWYAAKALESTIKIISNERGLSNGKEKGPHAFVDNLGSARASHFIADWEAKILKEFFTSLRNPFAHGAGDAELPELSIQQTNWAIEFCMTWAKSLIQRS